MKYKLLGKSGLRVSELCLGAMGFGTEWGFGSSKEESKKVFDAFLDAGGNFIDTANRYTEGSSEKFLGEFIQAEREQLVIATKYTLHDAKGKPNFSGNHRKNMFRSVEGSLKRLQTDYIDLLYLHAWDYTTPIEEVLRGLDDLVRMGKVHYIAISDTPAWIVSRGNAIAELRGWQQFVGMQIEYSLLRRDPERELLPMAEALGIGITAWGPIAGGALSGKYLTAEESPKRLKEGSARLNAAARTVAAEVVTVAAEEGCTPVQVAINWVRQKSANIIPVIGVRNAQQLSENLKSLNCPLSLEQFTRLEALTRPEPGFPHDFLSAAPTREVIYGGMENLIIIPKKRF